MDADVVIVGAGTAGAAAAWQLARRGMRVVVLERGPLDRAGARWSNGVSLRAFDRAGVPRPTAPEDRGGPSMHLIAGWGPDRVLVSSDVREVDMRALTARLQGLAADAGADFREGTAATGFDPAEGVQTEQGVMRAPVYVDASGMHGLPWLSAPRVPRDAMCAAAQQTHRLRDRAAAQAFFDRLGVAEGDVACFTSVAGGYSIVNVRYHGDEMAILTGSMPADGVPAGSVLLRRFVEEHADWVGERLWGGARPIPLLPPPDQLHEGPWLRIGDAGGMVYASHGSGIGPQLVASALAARVLASGGSVEDVSRAWRRREAPELRRAHAFHRFSRTIDAPTLARLIRAGLMHPDLIRAGLEQRTPSISPRLLKEMARAAGRDPVALAALAPGLVAMGRA